MTSRRAGETKKAMKLFGRFAVACVVVLAVAPVEARAYVDPSSGSMLLQIAVGGLLAGLVTVKMYWRKVRSIFRRDQASSE
jgi:Na+/proline symporter